MTDIVQRLRQEGEDAMRKHLSLGMHKLCEEAADEIERLRKALGPFVRVAEMTVSAAAGSSVGVNVDRCRDAAAALASPAISKKGE